MSDREYQKLLSELTMIRVGVWISVFFTICIWLTQL